MATSLPSYIEMRQRRFNYFPLSFQWQGRTFHVQSVERSWSKMGGPIFARRARRLCFRVRTVALAGNGIPAWQTGRFDIYQDLVANTWHLERSLA